MAVSKRLRYEVLRRDNHTCRYCGASAPDVKLVVDHVIPEALGGKSEPGNLVTACEPCNSGKSSTTPDAPLVEDVRQDAMRWAQAMAIAAEGEQAERFERNAYREKFTDAWSDWTFEYRGERKPIELPADWPTSLDAFRRAGLTEDDIKDAVDKAMRKKDLRHDGIFKYFCGICWRMLDDRRETASVLYGLLNEGVID